MQLSKYHRHLCTSCNTSPFANFSLTMGLFEIHILQLQCRICLAGCSATPCLPAVYVALLPGTGAGLGPCEPPPGPQRMWSGEWEHVERVCFDPGRAQFYKESVSGPVSVCLSVIDSPFFRCFLSFSKEKKNLLCPFFTRAGLYIFWHVMMCFWDSTVWKCIKIWSAACQMSVIQPTVQ